jgi:hypothetical protein
MTTVSAANLLSSNRKQDPSKAVKNTFNVGGYDEPVVLRRLRAIDKVEVGIQQSALVRGLPASSLNSEAQEFSYMLALLSVALVSPEDFSLADLDDFDLIDLWKEWDDWSRSFREARTKRAGSDSGQLSQND